VIVATAVQQVAVFILLIQSLVDQEEDNDITRVQANIAYGSLAALFTAGFVIDFLAQRNIYTLFGVLICLQLVFVFIQTIYMIIRKDSGVFLGKFGTSFVYGYFYCLSALMSLQQIPLYIAGRYRDLNSAWELPLAGQMLGLAQVLA
jgi:hypothetical protein